MEITLGFSSCPNDTYTFDALVHKKIDTKGIDFKVDYYGQCDNSNCIFEKKRYHGDFQCYFTKSGIYRISLYGTFPGFCFCDVMGGTHDSEMDSMLIRHLHYVDEVEQGFPDYEFSVGVIDYDIYVWNIIAWGSNRWLKMDRMFEHCRYLGISAIDAPNLRHVTSLDRMFYGCTHFNSNLNHWDVSHIQSMHGTFAHTMCFNKPLQRWNVSNVTNMTDMFNFARAFNQPLNRWDVSHVESMWNMFEGAKSFNQPLNHWDVSHVRDMCNMFFGAESFNQSLRDWNLSSLLAGECQNLGLECRDIYNRCKAPMQIIPAYFSSGKKCVSI